MLDPCARRLDVAWLGALGALLLGCTLTRDVDRLKGGDRSPKDAATEPADRDMGRPTDASGAGGQGGTTGGTDGAADARMGGVDGPGAADGAPDLGPRPPDTAPPAAPTATALFWVDSGTRTIHRAEIDGNGAQVLATLPPGTYLRSIAVDSADRKLYVTDSGGGKIIRADLDGGNLQDLVLGLSDPVGIDLELERQQLYVVTQGATDGVFRANLDGSALEPVIASGLLNPYGIAIDGKGSKLYVIDNRANAVFRANLDGSAFERLPIDGISTPIEIAFDPVDRKIYWGDYDPIPTIRRANLDGTGVEEVVNRAKEPAFQTPIGVAIDPGARKLYFIDGGTSGRDVIMRAELDGSNLEVLVGSGLTDPRGMALGF